MRSCIFSTISPVFSVTWSSEIILICWFTAQETFLIIRDENSYADSYFCRNCDTFSSMNRKNHFFSINFFHKIIDLCNHVHKKIEKYRNKKVNKSAFNCVLYLKSINSHVPFHQATVLMLLEKFCTHKVMKAFHVKQYFSFMQSSEMDSNQYSVFSSSISTTRSIESYIYGTWSRCKTPAVHPWDPDHRKLLPEYGC